MGDHSLENLKLSGNLTAVMEKVRELTQNLGNTRE